MATTTQDPSVSGGPPPATTTLRLYKRLANGRKALFAPSDTAPAHYFVVNPMPHKHHSKWTPVFYRGDNPKYTEAKVIGRAFRNSLWKKLEFQLGEGVGEVLENERKRAEAKKLKIKNRFRKVFGASEKTPEEDLDEKEVVGKILIISVARSTLFNRRMEWELDGVQYQWTGTRMFATSFMKGVKGWSHSLKLVRKSDHVLVATFEKSRWSSFASSIRSDGPPNKSKQLVGSLRVHAPVGNGGVVPEIRVEAPTPTVHEIQPVDSGFVNDIPAGSSELLDAIALTCWIVAEAEHRLRLKVLDMIQEAGEHAGEGGG